MNKISQAASSMGKIGGKASAEKRLGGLTAAERSQLMRDVRLSPSQKKVAAKMGQEMVDNLNKNVAE